MTSTMATVPGGAACYFCLGEEADEEGKPLVRDCSCRGDSAGFAHFSCLTTYAEQKCKVADVFSEPWKIL
jgi:E3 ubiquitin-protein ligase DOA10